MAFFGFTRQPEQGSVQVFSSDETQEQHTEETYDTQCAWCLQEQGRPMGNGSHGICSYHASLMIQAASNRRQR
jgi:hypothetical protein